MRSWLSLFFLAPALFAQMQKTPFAPDGVHQKQMQMLLLQTSPNQQPYFGRPQKPSQGRLNFFEPPAALPQGQTNYWNFQAPSAPERVQVQPAPTMPKLPAGNPTPKPLKIPRKNLHFYLNPEAAKPKICSIPLLNGLKPNSPVPDKMAIPAPQAYFKAEVVPPPAPPCDDGKR